MTKLYYTPPSDAVFNEAKELAIAVWMDISDNELYLKEKLRIKDWENVGDNFMALFSMFDMWRQRQVFQRASEELRSAFINRYVDGGGDRADFFYDGISM